MINCLYKNGRKGHQRSNQFYEKCIIFDGATKLLSDFSSTQVLLITFILVKIVPNICTEFSLHYVL